MKKVVAFALPLLAVLLGAPTPSQASDHADGLKTTLDLAADLTDLFTFTSPKNPDKLVMIMNVHGLANSTSRFSNAVDYKFRIRPIDDAKTLVPSADPAKERDQRAHDEVSDGVGVACRREQDGDPPRGAALVPE